LSGEGADEILAGYNLDVSQRRFLIIKRLQNFPSSVLKPLSTVLDFCSSVYGEKFTRIVRVPLPEWNATHKAHMTRLWNEQEKRALWPAFPGTDSGRILGDVYAAAASKDPLEQLLSVYQQSWLVEDLLMKADKMTMAASLELRVPFLDFRLVEWANRQPLRMKIGRQGRRYITKYVLRRFAKSRLPESIINRPKQGFPVPVNEWFRDVTFSKWALAHLLGDDSRLKDLFEPDQIQQHLRKAATGDYAAQKSWQLIVLETWMREFDVEVGREVPLHRALVTDC
jgi:asparagine synthase (glutamine-hydrolysing)